MKTLILLAMLAFSSPAMLSRAHELGTLVKTMHTPDGNVAVYRDAADCSLTFRGVIVDRVSLETCQS